MTDERPTKAKWFVAVPVLAVSMLLGGAAANPVQARDTPEKLSPQQLKELIVKAKTPADHEKLANFYQQEAARLKQDAEVHRDDANIYGRGQEALHCANLAKLDEQAAKEADELARLHRLDASNIRRSGK